MTQLSAILFLVFSISTHCFANETKQPPHPGPRSLEQARFLFEEAKSAQQEGKVDLAIEDYQKILTIYPQFKEKFIVYQELMKLHQTKKNYPEVLRLGKEAILQHPIGGFYSAIQLMRVDAQLQSGKAFQSRIIVDELLKAKPDANTISKALLFKAEALSQLGKNKEAFAALDAAKGNENHADAELKIRARACSSRKPALKEELLDYFHEKNMCFKESAALSKSSPAKDSSQVWCDRFQGFQSELKKSKLDKFTLEKLEKELESTRALSSTWGCL